MVYTNIPSILGRYLDPSKKAGFDRESFTPIGSFASNAIVIGVNKSSKYKSIKDLFTAAQAAPERSRSAPTREAVTITSTCGSWKTPSD